MTSFSTREAHLNYPAKGWVDGRLDGPTVMALAVAGAVMGSVAWLVSKHLSRQQRIYRNATARREFQANARRALAMKQSMTSEQQRPGSMTASEGMRSNPNTGIAPSGALNQEGHRPVLERSRKVR